MSKLGYLYTFSASFSFKYFLAMNFWTSVFPFSASYLYNEIESSLSCEFDSFKFSEDK